MLKKTSFLYVHPNAADGIPSHAAGPSAYLPSVILRESLTPQPLLMCAATPSLFVSISIYHLPRMVPPVTGATASTSALGEGHTSDNSGGWWCHQRLGNLLGLGFATARTRGTTGPDDPGRISTSERHPSPRKHWGEFLAVRQPTAISSKQAYKDPSSHK